MRTTEKYTEKKNHSFPFLSQTLWRPHCKFLATSLSSQRHWKVPLSVENNEVAFRLQVEFFRRAPFGDWKCRNHASIQAVLLMHCSNFFISWTWSKFRLTTVESTKMPLWNIIKIWIGCEYHISWLDLKSSFCFCQNVRFGIESASKLVKVFFRFEYQRKCQSFLTKVLHRVMKDVQLTILPLVGHLCPSSVGSEVCHAFDWQNEQSRSCDAAVLKFFSYYFGCWNRKSDLWVAQSTCGNCPFSDLMASSCPFYIQFWFSERYCSLKFYLFWYSKLKTKRSSM